MANTIKLRHSSTPGNIVTSLSDGEVAINQADGLLFWRDDSGTIHSLDLTGGSAPAGSSMRHGQCQLIKDGSNIRLVPFNGNKLIVNGIECTIPDAGVALAPTGLNVQKYYIYATASAGAVSALEASTTAPAVSTSANNKGVKIKTGDDTRTLVGMAEPVLGPFWTDSPQQRFVRSWFNRQRLSLSNSFTAIRTSTAGAGFAEIDPEIRVAFLAWDGECITVAGSGSMFSNGASAGSVTIAVGLDNISDLHGQVDIVGVSSTLSPWGVAATIGPLSEGAHVLLMVGKATINTGKYGGNGNFGTLSAALG